MSESSVSVTNNHGGEAREASTNNSATIQTSTPGTAAVVETSKNSGSSCGLAVDESSSGTPSKISTDHSASTSTATSTPTSTETVSECQSSSGAVPNFRVEGSGRGDSSITVALVSLSSAVPPLSDRNGEQSSEEMKLSLVSWYSEPEDPSGVRNSSCCQTEGSRQAISMTSSLLTKGGSEEKENVTPKHETELRNGHSSLSTSEMNGQNNVKGTKGHVKLDEETPTMVSKVGKLASRSFRRNPSDATTADCPKCTRRSKSGSTTPATTANQHLHHHHHVSRTPANRRVMPSNISSTQLKKPIKSILKDSRGGSGGSGSGSDNKSSMDSLGSADIKLGRAEGCNRAKFNLKHQTFPCSSDNSSSSLSRIEKYATLRLRKGAKARPIQFSDCGTSTSDVNSSSNGGSNVVTPSELMSKSMSFLEKSSSSSNKESCASATPGAGSLKRQGSLRQRSSQSPHWDPSATRTSTLRMQKMQQAKAAKEAKSGGGGSTHSGSGESINAHSSSNTSRSSSGHNKGLKVFAKLSSAMGQTASSNQKRLRQEKSVQTDKVNISEVSGSDAGSLSPEPGVDYATDMAEQVKHLEKLVHRYRASALKFQSEFEKSEAKKLELTKQLQETQTENTEMVEFLQAEKSTLADTLTELETEAKKWRQELEKVENDAQSRCSSLVRLSEQHKQEAQRAETLLKNAEHRSTTTISALTHQISEGKQVLSLTYSKVKFLVETIRSVYNIPLHVFDSIDKYSPEDFSLTNPSLVPLITSLSEDFLKETHDCSFVECETTDQEIAQKSKATNFECAAPSDISSKVAGSNSLQNLNNAIMDREAAEEQGLEEIVIPQECQTPVKQEVILLQKEIQKLLVLVKVIASYSDKHFTSIASSIRQCLQSKDEDKTSNGVLDMVGVESDF